VPITVTDTGSNNAIEIEQSLLSSGSGEIIFEGDNNKVILKPSRYNVRIHLHLKDGATISFGEDLNARSLSVYAAQGAALDVGRMGSFNGAVRLLMHEASRLTIGDNCLFASDVIVSVSDMHSIVDADTGARTNPARSISIGDRVWVGMRCIVLKGVSIGPGSAIGAGSVVSRDVPANCIAAGNPARVVRRNATWDFRLL
jgi:acetyltransferase-like isoleucine patch superfamily enzyme